MDAPDVLCLTFLTWPARCAHPACSFVQVPATTAQTFQDLQAELVAAFGGASSPRGQLLTPDDVRAALGAAPGADLQELLLRAPGGAW